MSYSTQKIIQMEKEREKLLPFYITWTIKNYELNKLLNIVESMKHMNNMDKAIKLEIENIKKYKKEKEKFSVKREEYIKICDSLLKDAQSRPTTPSIDQLPPTTPSIDHLSSTSLPPKNLPPTPYVEPAKTSTVFYFTHTATKLINSVMKPETGKNDINVILYLDTILKDYITLKQYYKFIHENDESASQNAKIRVDNYLEELKQYCNDIQTNSTNPDVQTKVTQVINTVEAEENGDEYNEENGYEYNEENGYEYNEENVDPIKTGPSQIDSSQYAGKKRKPKKTRKHQKPKKTRKHQKPKKTRKSNKRRPKKSNKK